MLFMIAARLLSTAARVWTLVLYAFKLQTVSYMPNRRKFSSNSHELGFFVKSGIYVVFKYNHRVGIIETDLASSIFSAFLGLQKFEEA